MTRYAILPRADWDGRGPITADTPGVVIRTEGAALHATIQDMCDRNALGFPSVRAKLRRDGSVYLAAARGAKHPSGVIVRRLED